MTHQRPSSARPCSASLSASSCTSGSRAGCAEAQHLPSYVPHPNGSGRQFSAEHSSTGQLRMCRLRAACGRVSRGTNVHRVTVRASWQNGPWRSVQLNAGRWGAACRRRWRAGLLDDSSAEESPINRLSWPESAIWPIAAGRRERHGGDEGPPSQGKGATGMGAVVVLFTGATVLGTVIASVIAEERGRWQRH